MNLVDSSVRLVSLYEARGAASKREKDLLHFEILGESATLDVAIRKISSNDPSPIKWYCFWEKHSWAEMSVKTVDGKTQRILIHVESLLKKFPTLRTRKEELFQSLNDGSFGQLLLEHLAMKMAEEILSTTKIPLQEDDVQKALLLIEKWKLPSAPKTNRQKISDHFEIVKIQSKVFFHLTKPDGSKIWIDPFNPSDGSAHLNAILASHPNPPTDEADLLTLDAWLHWTIRDMQTVQKLNINLRLTKDLRINQSHFFDILFYKEKAIWVFGDLYIDFDHPERGSDEIKEELNQFYGAFEMCEVQHLLELMDNSEKYAPKLTFQEMIEIFKFIQMEKNTLVRSTTASGKSFDLHPKDSGLARTIVVAPEGKIFILFNRKGQGDLALGQGGFKLATTAIEFETGEIYASISPLKDKNIDGDIEILEKITFENWDEEFPKLEGKAEYYSDKQKRDKKRIFLKLCNKGDLNEAITRRTITLEQRKEIFVHLIHALAYIEEKNCVHRDLKPANILLHVDPKTGRLFVFISDFGMMTPLNRKTQLTKAQGSPHFLSPEYLISCYTKNEIQDRLAKIKIDCEKAKKYLDLVADDIINGLGNFNLQDARDAEEAYNRLKFEQNQLEKDQYLLIQQATTPAHDVWALGITLAELFHIRFSALDSYKAGENLKLSPIELENYMRKKLEKKLRMAFIFATPAESLIKKMLAFDPKDRPTAKELKAMLPKIIWPKKL